ncbi:hypothetical protein [Alcanivorax sp.]|uniref:hypothetical protein n=1 Tax=Alcanivorax sp. TaxID=1872427 RepID=UPI0032D968ED
MVNALSCVRFAQLLICHCKIPQMISCSYAAHMGIMKRRLLTFLLVLSASGASLPGYAEKSEQGNPEQSVVAQDTKDSPEESPTESVPESTERLFHPNPCGHLSGEASWVDRTHDWMSRTVCGPTRWVDGFFIGSNEIDEEQPGTQLRIIGASRWQDNDDDGREIKIRARVELPNAQERLSLLFENDDDVGDELSNDLESRPEDVGNDSSGFRTALRWVTKMPDRMNLDLDAGLRSEITAFVRARYRWRTPLPGNKMYFRFTQKGYWEDPEGFGINSLFELDRPVTQLSTFRFSSEYELTEENNELNRDWYFNQRVSLYTRLGKQSGIGYSVGFDGYTDPIAAIEAWRTSVRFRRSVWRPWFFYEIEPYVFWPRSLGYEGITGIVLRMEVQAGLPVWE